MEKAPRPAIPEELPASHSAATVNADLGGPSSIGRPEPAPAPADASPGRQQLPRPPARACPHCHHPLQAADLPELRGMGRCPRCRRTFEAEVLSPPERPRLAIEPAATDESGTAAGCPRHPRNAVIATCDRCGSFVCGLCRIGLGAETYCITCFEKLEGSGRLGFIRTYFRNYSSIVAWLLLFNLLCCYAWPLTIFLGPLSIYLCYLGWQEKNRMGDPKGRIGLILLALLGGVMFLAMAALSFWFINNLLQEMAK